MWLLQFGTFETEKASDNAIYVHNCVSLVFYFYEAATHPLNLCIMEVFAILTGPAKTNLK